MSTASLVEAVLTLQEQQDQQPSLPTYEPVLVERSHEESGTTEPCVSRTDSNQHMDASAAAAPADVNGKYRYVYCPYR